MDKEGIKNQDWYRDLLEKTFFKCWPLLKDLIAPSEKLSYTSTYFAPVEDSHCIHFVRFLFLIGQLINQNPLFAKYEVDTKFDYYEFENRPPFLDKLRKELRDGRTKLVRTKEYAYQYGKIMISLEPQEETLTIWIR